MKFYTDNSGNYYQVCGCGKHYSYMIKGRSLRRINEPFSLYSKFDYELVTEISEQDFINWYSDVFAPSMGFAVIRLVSGEPSLTRFSDN